MKNMPCRHQLDLIEGVGFNMMSDMEEELGGIDAGAPITPLVEISLTQTPPTPVGIIQEIPPTPKDGILLTSPPPLSHHVSSETLEMETSPDHVATPDPKGKNVVIEESPMKVPKNKNPKKTKKARVEVIPLPSFPESSNFLSHVPKLNNHQKECFENGIPSLPQAQALLVQLGQHLTAGSGPTRSTFGAVEQENSRLKSRTEALEKEIQDLKDQLAWEKADRVESAALHAQVEKEAAEVLKRTQDRLNQALEKHALEVKNIEATTAAKLKELQENHAKSLEEHAAATLEKYLSGARYAYRSDYHANYRYGLLYLMYKKKLADSGLGHMKIDYNDTLGLETEPPTYQAPPTGVFADDGDKPLESWSLIPLNRRNLVVPEKKKLLPDPMAPLKPMFREILQTSRFSLPPKLSGSVPSQTIVEAQKAKELEAQRTKELEAQKAKELEAQMEKSKQAVVTERVKALAQKRAEDSRKSSSKSGGSGDGRSRGNQSVDKGSRSVGDKSCSSERMRKSEEEIGGRSKR